MRAARGAGGGYRFTGNPRRVTLMDVIELFEDISATKSTARRAAADASSPSRAPRHSRSRTRLGVVLLEIDEIAKATFRSITLETMLKLVARRRGANARA